jgi:DNA-binding HxlR family transcriptional regulator
MESIAKGEAPPHAACRHFHAAIELIGRRWNGVILRELFDGADRFSALRSAIPGITDAMLSQRLRELEDAGLVHRQVISSRPVEIHYSITEIGARLAPVFNALGQWSEEWGEVRKPTVRP